MWIPSSRFKEAREALKTAFKYQSEQNKWLFQILACDVALWEAEDSIKSSLNAINNYIALQKGALSTYFPLLPDGEKHNIWRPLTKDLIQSLPF